MVNKSGVRVEGIEIVNANLKREVAKIEGDTFRGVKIALAWLSGVVLKLTPVDFGILRNSIFTSATKRKGVIDAIIGFTAEYAPFVHEKISANFKAPGTQAKFLEEPVMENQTEILQIIAKEARL